MNTTQEINNTRVLQDLLKQIIEMILYLPDVPQAAKTELLNKASKWGIRF